MKSRFGLFVAACWVMGAVALVASTVSAQGVGSFTAYLPFTVRRQMLHDDPLLSHYLGLTASEMDGDTDYYTVYPNGNGWTNITRNDVDDYAAAWSPDASTLLYANMDGTWLALANSHTLQLTHRPDPYSVDTWSPTSEYVLYKGEDTANSRDPVYLYTVSTNTSTAVGVDNAVPQTLAWSPDGAHVAITTRDEAGTLPARLWLYTPAEAALLLLAEGDSFDIPQWSPDGQAVMFTRRVTTGGTENFSVLLSDTTGAVTTVVDGFQASAWLDNGTHLLLWKDSTLFLDKRDGSVPLRFNLEVQDVLVRVSVAPEGSRVIYYERVKDSELPYFRTTAPNNAPVALASLCAFTPKPESLCTQHATWAADGKTFITNYTVAVQNFSDAGWILSNATVTPPAKIEEYRNEDNSFYLPSSSRFVSSLSSIQSPPKPIYYSSLLTDINGNRRTVPLPDTSAFVEAWRYLP